MRKLLLLTSLFPEVNPFFAQEKMIKVKTSSQSSEELILGVTVSTKGLAKGTQANTRGDSELLVSSGPMREASSNTGEKANRTKAGLSCY